jgi:hypothetical protein
VAIFCVVGICFFWQLGALKEVFSRQTIFNKRLMVFDFLSLLPLLLLPIMMIRARRGDVMTGSHIDLVSSVVGSTLRQGFETQDTTSVKSKFLSLSLIP